MILSALVFPNALTILIKLKQNRSSASGWNFPDSEGFGFSIIKLFKFLTFFHICVYKICRGEAEGQRDSSYVSYKQLSLVYEQLAHWYDKILFNSA